MLLQANLKRAPDNEENTAVKTTRMSLLKRVLQFFDTKDLPLEHNIFLYTAAAGLLMVMIGIGYNILNDLGILILPVYVLYILMNISCAIYSIVTKRWYRSALIVVGSSVFLLIPFLWFTIGGATGSTGPVLLVGALCVAFVFKGAVRIGMLSALSIMSIVFVVLEYHYPDIIIPYSGREEQFEDLVFTYAMCIVVSSILVYRVMNAYTKLHNEKMRLVNRLEHISQTDALTGLYNRRFLSASIDEEMRRSYDTGSQLTVCILDIDYFKEINDTYGHEYGDNVLINIAQIMRDSLTEEEIFGRYGGEEFVVLSPGKTAMEALPIVQALCDRVRAHAWSHGKPVTLSGGLSSYVKGISYSEFLEAADTNLYLAKGEGRDRVIYR
ncbi:MAG: GGDEF domain-containing protein [Thermoleophilia bacterium]|jgi:diguanylate cyclase (GGDEF)-like protein